MSIIKHSKVKIVVFLVATLIIWQAVKFMPFLQLYQSTNTDYSPQAQTLTPVLVSVFYEALCPDSKNFIVKQLLPTSNLASRLLNVSLIPFGKASVQETEGGSFSFTCQHGPVECTANIVHACSIAEITNPTLRLKYVACMISDNAIPELAGERCARELLIDWKPILECTSSDKGNLLLYNYGKITESLDPKMYFVPTVLLNNKQVNQASVLKNLFKEVCSILNNKPFECASQL